jgi:hypothetical protein
MAKKSNGQVINPYFQRCDFQRLDGDIVRTPQARIPFEGI